LILIANMAKTFKCVLVHVSVALLVLSTGSSAFPITKTDLSTVPCNLITQTCNTVQDKMPPVVATKGNVETMETNLDVNDKAAFEHLLAKAFRDSAPVTWATDAFAKRIASFIVGAAKLNKTDENAALMAAFSGPKYNQHNTGYVGPNITAIRRVLGIDGGKTGNVREVWGLIYVLTHTDYMSTLLGPLADAGNYAAIAKLGMNATYTKEQQYLVNLTNHLNGDFKYSNGMLSYTYPAFNSWSRFDFEAQTVAGKIEWNGTRVYKSTGCGEVNLTSDQITNPPLSYDELTYQCNGSKIRPCKLLWQPGQLCFDIVQADFAPGVKGYKDRAGLLGYRTVAGPSGTTANVMQMAKLLNFNAQELVLFRLTMHAWMLGTNDHSFYEIMLGADDFMPQTFKMAQALKDLGQTFPADIKTSDGHTFQPSSVWFEVNKQIATTAGMQLFAKLGKVQQTYLNTLTRHNDR